MVEEIDVQNEETLIIAEEETKYEDSFIQGQLGVSYGEERFQEDNINAKSHSRLLCYSIL